MKSNGKRRFLFSLLNILIPILIGGISYYIFSPEVIFVRKIDEISGIFLHVDVSENPLLILIGDFAYDALWAYALLFAVYLILGNQNKYLLLSLAVSFVFSSGMEILQVTPFFPGTFDVLDIAIQVFAELLAVFINLKKYGGIAYEKDD